MRPLEDLLTFCEQHREELPEALQEEIKTRLTLLRASDASSLGTDTLLRVPETGPESADTGTLLRPAEAHNAPDKPPHHPTLWERLRHPREE